MAQAKEHSEGEQAADEVQTGQEADRQLAVNTLFYGVRGQQVCPAYLLAAVYALVRGAILAVDRAASCMTALTVAPAAQLGPLCACSTTLDHCGIS